jgi:hypothetical protein
MYAATMPGFSAEASLCRSGANYQVVSNSGGVRQAGKGVIQPALPRLEYNNCQIYTALDPQDKRVTSCCGARIGGTYVKSCCNPYECWREI